MIAWPSMAWDDMTHIETQHDCIAQHDMEWWDAMIYITHNSMTAWSIMAWDDMACPSIFYIISSLSWEM